MRRLAFFAFLLVLHSSLVTHHSSLAFAQVITTAAGGQWVFRGDGGLATKAPLGWTTSAAVDAAGNVYAADLGNNLVVKISPAGVLTVVAGNGIAGYSGDGGPATRASLAGPNGVAMDSAGNLYIVDMYNNRIRKVISGGTITTVVGDGFQGTDDYGLFSGRFSGDGGPATGASLSLPAGVAVDSAGNLYIADQKNDRVRKVSPGGTITTVAGGFQGTYGYGRFSGDGGPATGASLYWPEGVAVDSAGNLYIADTFNNRIRKVSPNGTITTVAGNGYVTYFADGGPATSASLAVPCGVALDSTGNLYIADTLNHRIRKVSPGGMITTVAGDGFSDDTSSNGRYSGDGGPATSASLNWPSGAAVDSAGNLYIADSANNRIRKVNPGGAITTFAGNGSYKFAGDGQSAANAALNGPAGVALDPAGNLYIAEYRNHRVRKVSPGGIITTVAGNGTPIYSGDGGPATSASLDQPFGVAVDAVGNLYIADTENSRIRKVSPGGIITTVAGGGSILYLGDGGPATSASLAHPEGVAVDSAGNLYIADWLNNRIRKVSSWGMITTVAGDGFEDASSNRGRYSGDGGPATSASLNRPCGVAVDAVLGGNLYYIADSYNNRIRRVSLSGTITTVAGNGNDSYSGDGGPATSASLDWPSGVAVDSAGNLYIADIYNSRIRKVNPVGIISTVAGNFGWGYSGDGGPATAASLKDPSGVAVDPVGNLYIADRDNDRIRKVLAAAPTFAVAPTSLGFTATAGAAAMAPQLAAVTSAVSGLAWAASASAPWLSVAPVVGTTPGLISVGVGVSNLSPGAYHGTVTVQAPLAANPIQTIAVELTVLPPGDAKPTVDTPSLTFETTAAAGNPPAKTLVIGNSGGGNLQWTARPQTSSGGNWLSLSSASGTASAAAPAAVYVSARAAGLSPGVYSGLITIESPSSTQPQTVAVDLLISQVTQTVSLSQTALRFTAVEGEATAPQKFGIVNTGQGVMNWTARAETVNGGSWLAVSPASGQSEAGSVIVSQAEAAVNTRGLPRGTYAGVIRVDAPAANNSPRLVTVVLTVLPAGSKTGTRLSPSGLIFSARTGGGSPSSQLVSLTTSNPGQVTASGQPFTISGSDWLKVLPANLVVSASDPRTIVVQPDVSKLAAGEYRASLTFMFDDGSPPQAVDIYFLVVGSTVSASSFTEFAAAGCTAKKLIAVDRSLGPNFTAQVGAASGLEVQVVDDCGSLVSDATAVANFSNGDAPVSLSYLRDGIYTGTWRPGKAGAAVTATLRSSRGSLPSLEILRQGKVEEGAKTPAVFPGGVVHAASFTPNGALAPGSIISVFGANLGSTGAWASSLPLPKTLAGASLQVGGYEVPLFYSSGGQINAQLPFELPVNSRPQLIVKGADFVTVPETITVAAARPGIFTTSQDGKGQGIIMDVNNRLVDASNPAKAGDMVVVYCTGLGTTNPAVRSGEAAPASPLAKVVTPVTVTIGGRPATVQFAGLTPGYVGLYQVNVQIPGGISPGASVPLVISQDGVPSNTVALAIQ
jgi:uncharacterized protein (TIGR03437 family)